ncbi:ABC transporter ATP-binding protein [Rhodoferax sp.]|uniref:ABC transporter ATP-binding protein n=1 Tax=Rhodoferax sp. TaxID=50421 RepID=UPI00374D7171
MASIKIRNICKQYGSGANAHTALSNVSMDIPDGGFVALLGPSGSGKTTILRAIAGLETLDGGSIEIDGVTVSGPNTHLPPEQRRVAVVFQNHALWPQMTVAENVMFPLLVTHKRSAEMEQRVRDALANVDLEPLAERYPDQLSGGQKQRVALARAMVGNPQVILFDEPLASLDVELRRDMQRLIARSRSPQTAIVYVTHNQEEALALADRVAVLSGGKIHQLDTPLALSQEPATRMVASFVGGRNILQAKVLRSVAPGTVLLEFNGYTFTARCHHQPTETTAWVSVQPSAFACAAQDDGLGMQVDYVFFQGDSHLVEGRCVAGENNFLTVRLPLSEKPAVGSQCQLRITDAWVLPENAA